MRVYDDQNTTTRADDDELRRITGIDPSEEKKMEENAVHDGSVAEKNESEELNDPDDTKGQKNDQSTDKNNEVEDDKDESPSLFTGTGSSKGLLARFRGSSAAKKWMVGAGAGLMVGVVGGIIALITFLLPFKVTHMINQIEQRLGEVPQYAVERRLEYYMNRYLILRTLASSVGEENINKNNYVYLGDGVFSTLYTNWRGSNLEGKLAQQGWRLETRTENAGQIFGKRSISPTDWVLVNDNVSVNSPLHRQELDSKQARAFIKEFATSETKSSQVFKRYNMRKMLKRYYGVNDWKFFETQRNNARNSYLEKKLALKQKLIKKVVDPVSTRYGAYLNCLLEGSKAKCKDELNRGGTSADNPEYPEEVDPETGEPIGGGGGDEARAAANSNPLGTLTDETVDIADNALKTEIGEVAEKALGRKISAQIQKLGVKKILASFAAGIGLIDTVAQIVNSVNSGALNIIVYDKNAQQYANFAAPVLSMADQIRSGDASIDDARFVNEMFNNFQSSPVYQAEFGSKSGLVSASASSGAQIKRDCNNDDEDGEETLLAPGETVCPDKRLVQDKTSFTDNSLWGTLTDIVDAYNSTLGKIVGGFNKLVSAVTSAIGLDALTQAIMDGLGIDKLLAKSFEFLLNRIAGPGITGAEVEEDAYDAFYAGMAVNYSSVGGGVGASREGTVGGGYLSEEQVLAIRNEGVEERIYAKQFESITDRYFSLENTNSLATKTLMSVPTSFSQLASSLAAIPTIATHGFGALFTQSAGAQTVNSTNPFHAIWYGYPTNHPIFTANNGVGMGEAEIEATYKCSLPAAERPQNQISNYGRPDDLPFDVAQEADPCLLEEVVGDVGRRAFDKSYDEQIEIATPPVAGGDIAGQDTSNLPCPVSPTIRDPGIESEAYKDGVRYTIRLCSVHGVRLNSIIAKSFDDMFTSMASQGFTIRGTGGFRDMASQIAGYANGRGKGTFSKPGFSNHQFGTAADISCQGGGASYQAGTGRGLQSFLAGVAAYPCLDFVHKNSYKYGLYLQCDGQSSSGGEIRANSGGCEWWHVSPTGG